MGRYTEDGSVNESYMTPIQSFMASQGMTRDQMAFGPNLSQPLVWANDGEHERITTPEQYQQGQASGQYTSSRGFEEKPNYENNLGQIMSLVGPLATMGGIAGGFNTLFNPGGLLAGGTSSMGSSGGDFLTNSSNEVFGGNMGSGSGLKLGGIDSLGGGQASLGFNPSAGGAGAGFTEGGLGLNPGNAASTFGGTSWGQLGQGLQLGQSGPNMPSMGGGQGLGTGGTAAGAGAATGAAGIWDTLSKQFPNATFGNALAAILQYGQMSGLGDDLSAIAERALQANNPFKAPERQPFIGRNSPLGMQSLLESPQGFLDTDPFIQAQKKAIGEQSRANFAKSGNLPFNEIMGSAQLGEVMGNQYKDRLGLTSILGGYTMNNPYAGSSYAQSATPGAIQNAGAYSGFGTLLGNNPTNQSTQKPGNSNPAGNIFNWVSTLGS